MVNTLAAAATAAPQRQWGIRAASPIPQALVAAALFLSAVMTVAGLDKRIALWILSKV